MHTGRRNLRGLLPRQHHDAAFAHDTRQARTNAARQRIGSREGSRNQRDADVLIAESVLHRHRQFYTTCARANDGDAGAFPACGAPADVAHKCSI